MQEQILFQVKEAPGKEFRASETTFPPTPEIVSDREDRNVTNLNSINNSLFEDHNFRSRGGLFFSLSRIGEQMATVAESDEKSDFSSTESPFVKASKTLEQLPWIEYAVQQAQFAQKTLEETIDSSIQVAESRFSEIRSTSSAHLNQTLDSFQDIKSEYTVYEDAFFGKIKEGIVVAAANPMVTCGVAAGLGIIGLKRPRRFLISHMSRLFMSEETLLSRADAKVKALRQSIESVKAESEILEKKALQAEEEMRRGRTKLRQAGTQIQGVIRSAYKIERQARGLKDIVGELPSREASRFRSQVSNLASEAKKERNTLTKEVSRISNYGISV